MGTNEMYWVMWSRGIWHKLHISKKGISLILQIQYPNYTILETKVLTLN
jgi:hypothetical protein